MTTIKTYSNHETRMASLVMKGSAGWHVQLKDLDEDEFLPLIRIFPFNKFNTDIAAKDYARTLVYGAQPQEDTPSLEARWFAHR